MTRIRVIDLETTGLVPPAEIIEIGRSDLVWGAAGPVIDDPLAWLYRPLNGIPPDNMAVHHITEDDFGPNAPVCTPDRLSAAVFHLSVPEILVAHNCEFQRQFITPAVTGAIPWICTYKGGAAGLARSAPAQQPGAALLAGYETRPCARHAAASGRSRCLGHGAYPRRPCAICLLCSDDRLDERTQALAGNDLRQTQRYGLGRDSYRLSSVDERTGRYGCGCPLECAAVNCAAPGATSGAVAAQPLADFACEQMSSRMVDFGFEPEMRIGAC